VLPRGPQTGLGSFAIHVVGVAGYVDVIYELLRRRERFDRARGSIATSDNSPGQSRFVPVWFARAVLVVAGTVLAWLGLLVSIDWTGGDRIAHAGGICPPGFREPSAGR
jgi:hypothetical protein